MKIWTIHNRDKDLNKIFGDIRRSATNKTVIDRGATWVQTEGQFLEVDGSDIVVIHNGILEDVNGREFFAEKRRVVKTWIIVSGMNRYEGRVINGVTDEECQFQESELHWAELLDNYEQIKDDVALIAATLSQGTAPWRYEYFQEVTLRLLSLNAENISVIKPIIGIDEDNHIVEGEYERRALLDEAEKRTFINARAAVITLLEKQREVNLMCVDPESAALYSLIHRSLYDLCRKQREAGMV